MSEPSSRAPRASRSLTGGATVLAVGRYAGSVFGFVSSIIIVRELTQHDFGQYALVLSIMAIIGMLADLRLSRAVLVSLFDAGDEAGRVVGSYLGLRLVIGVVSYGALMAIVVAVGYPQVVVVAALLGGLSLVIGSEASALQILCEARLWLPMNAVAVFLGFVAQLAIVAALAASGHASVVTFMWASVLNVGAMFLWLWWRLRRVARLRIRFDYREWWPWLKEAAPLSLGMAFDIIYFRIDIVMLSILGTFAATGLYGVAYKFSDIVGAVVPFAVMTPALTLFVQSWPHDLDRFHRTFRHSLLLLTIVGVGASVGFAFVAWPMISTFYGADYAPASGAAIWLLASQALHFYTIMCFMTLMAVKRNVLYPVAMILGVAVNVGLNLYLIPHHSYLGAAVATAVTEVVVIAVMGWGVLHIRGVRPLPWVPLAKIALSALLTAGAMYGAGRVASWPVVVAVGAAVFLGVLHLLRVDGPGGLRRLLDRELVEGAPVSAQAESLALATDEVPWAPG